MQLGMDCQIQQISATNISSVPKQSKSSRLVSQANMMAGQNVKKKYLMCQIPIEMLKQHATPISSLHNSSSKGCRKTSQKWIYVRWAS